MATPLDFGLLNDFGVIFPMIFVFVVVYGVLSKVKFFESQTTNAAIATVLALMTLLSDIAIKTVNRMAPFMVLLVILIVFLMLAFMTFGVKEGDITGVVKTEAYSVVKMTIIALVAVIFFGSLFSAISEETGFQSLTNATSGAGNNADGSFNNEQQDFFKIIFHPKILGMVVILLIMLFTVLRLAAAPQKPW